MKEVAQKYQDLLVQIATPYSTGTGFFLKEANLIVTKEHIIRDNRRAVIEGTLFAQQMADIIYVDQKYDLAFLAVPPDLEIPTINLASDPILEETQNIISIGHRFGQKIAISEGEIIIPQYDRHHIIYIKHDAVLSPGNSGGPLINTKGEVIGINTFIALEDNFVGYALPVSYLHETVYDFLSGKVRMALRCHSCSSIVFENTIVNKHCPRCNSKVELPSQVEEYEPSGMSNTIEILLNKMGHDSQLSRRGPNNWEIKEGSAKINISYYEKNGLIIGDAYLCSLPEEGTKPLYEYLLKQNYKTEGLTLSVKEGDIVLSLLIYDRYLNVKTGTKLLQHLFERADYYDNVLVEEFGALWKKEEQQEK